MLLQIAHQTSCATLLSTWMTQCLDDISNSQVEPKRCFRIFIKPAKSYVSLKRSLIQNVPFGIIRWRPTRPSLFKLSLDICPVIRGRWTCSYVYNGCILRSMMLWVHCMTHLYDHSQHSNRSRSEKDTYISVPPNGVPRLHRRDMHQAFLESQVRMG